MPRGGRRDGAGRPPGSPNKRNAKLQEAVARGGITPLDYLLSVMRNKKEDPDRRLDAAKSAAPFVHAKLSAIAVKQEHVSRPIEQLSDAELYSLIEQCKTANDTSDESRFSDCQ